MEFACVHDGGEQDEAAVERTGAGAQLAALEAAFDREQQERTRNTTHSERGQCPAERARIARERLLHQHRAEGDQRAAERAGDEHGEQRATQHRVAHDLCEARRERSRRHRRRPPEAGPTTRPE